MEGPINSSVNKFAASKEAEESGWTQYLVDFSSEQREFSFSSYPDDSFGSPSLVSDAASPANAAPAWNFSNNKEVIACTSMGGPQFPTSLNVKKQRSKKYSCDDLEDTASSPVNSPKVSSLKPMDTKYRRTDDSFGNFMEKDAGTHHHSAWRMDKGSSSINLEGLKKRGLCLMPFSMVVNYL